MYNVHCVSVAMQCSDVGEVICDILCALRKLNHASLALSQVVFVDLAAFRLLAYTYTRLVNEAVLPKKALFLPKDSDGRSRHYTFVFIHHCNIAQSICLVICRR